ncbi:MetS family NSS transporter small subunit [Leucobacter sp. cx-328]|uniref:MetS family NSS transporter small subunit n=1 Tax=unclassified Leucobacter TaxID=2621730 RepID=UPI00165DE1BB|nr:MULTISPECIES: MetS family NSS transporter small subunit [unclassified Leucobacter]MBC9944531.1 MetS family NSS transporter small subunit [Leucobacter sp. cx-328]
MTPISITFMVLSFVLLWGGLIASSIFLTKRPELDESEYPEGESDDVDEALHKVSKSYE